MNKETFYYHGESGMRTTEQLAHYLLDFDLEVAIVESSLRLRENELGEKEVVFKDRHLESLDIQDLRLLAQAYLEKIGGPPTT
jgi:hypothetical protein